LTQLCNLGITLYFLFHYFPSLPPFCVFSILSSPVLCLFFPSALFLLFKSLCFSFSFLFVFFLFFSLSPVLLFFLFSILSSLSFCSSFFFQLPWFSNNVPLFFIPPFLSVFFQNLSLSQHLSLKSFSPKTPLIVSLFSSGIYKQEEREPPYPVQSWLKVWHGAASVQPPKNRSQGMDPLSFLHHSGTACGDMGYARVWASREGERGGSGGKKLLLPLLCVKGRRSVVSFKMTPFCASIFF